MRMLLFVIHFTSIYIQFNKASKTMKGSDYHECLEIIDAPNNFNISDVSENITVQGMTENLNVLEAAERTKAPKDPNEYAIAMLKSMGLIKKLRLV